MEEQFPFRNWKSLRDWRLSKGVSLADIAAKLECSIVHLNRVERGLEQLTETEMAKIWSRK